MCVYIFNWSGRTSVKSLVLNYSIIIQVRYIWINFVSLTTQLHCYWTAFVLARAHRNVAGTNQTKRLYLFENLSMHLPVSHLRVSPGWLGYFHSRFSKMSMHFFKYDFASSFFSTSYWWRSSSLNPTSVQRTDARPVTSRRHSEALMWT